MLVSNVRMVFMRDLKATTTCRSGSAAGAGDRMTVFCTEHWGSVGGTIGRSGGHASTTMVVTRFDDCSAAPAGPGAEEVAAAGVAVWEAIVALVEDPLA